MKIVVAGTGYVDLSNTMLLVVNNEVIAVDIASEKVEQLIVDAEMSQYLTRDDINFRATSDKREAYEGGTRLVLRSKCGATILSFPQTFARG